LTAHDPPESVHVKVWDKLGRPLLSQVNVPVGDSPDTLAVQMLVEPVAIGDGEHVTAMVVMSFTTESE
jgi:hypothetical protein